MKFQLNPLLKSLNILSVVTILLILWVIFGKLDVLAQAPGKIISVEKIKTINVLNSSIIHEVKVREGQLVNKGQTLAVLDSVESNSDFKTIDADLKLNILKLRRLHSQLNNEPFLIIAFKASSVS